jgi:hypothetical protein
MQKQTSNTTVLDEQAAEALKNAKEAANNLSLNSAKQAMAAEAAADTALKVLSAEAAMLAISAAATQAVEGEDLEVRGKI